MKKLFLLFASTFFFLSEAQNPGLVISEVLANPAGTDSCKEYVELLATQNINFSLTPYTIVVCNNGAANSSGWVAGGSLSYAFAINSGSVSAGNIVYVGGSCMTPTSAPLKVLNVKYVNGDWNIGSANASGVFGNGGSNADGVAVFNLPVSSITSTTVPTDALFFGTGIGTASVNAGSDGYQLPINDFYSGGKLNSSSFIGPDPSSDVIITSSGLFNMATGTWSVNRSLSTGTVQTDGITSLSLSTTGTVTPATISFFSSDTTVNESSATANIYLRITSASTASSSISVYATAFSNASATDYTLGSTTFTFPANAPVNSTAAVSFSINNDVLAESAEYIILRFYNLQNAAIGSNQQHALYIADNDKIIPQASNSLTLNLLSSFSNTVSGSNSAEIVAHDPSTQRLYIANSVGGKLDIVDFANPSSPSLILSVPITTYGNINSLAVKSGTVACAMEGSNPQDSGRVVFFNSMGTYISQVKVGMMPDMITFNNAGTRVLTANEGEPNSTYTLDPDGSVSIINIAGGLTNLTTSNVAHVTFTSYNGQESTLRAQGIRIFGLNANAARDFEPEYITVAKDDSKAWVTLQENNAIAEIDLNTYSITALRPLGTKNHSLLDNGMDISNVAKGINVSNFPVKGFYLPDAIASYSVGGVNYLVTANEGDTRDYPSGGFTEEVRIGSANLDAAKFPFASQMKHNSVMGRLLITNRNGDTDNDGDLDSLYSIGARSFSIWNANTGNLVYDSKDELERITATGSFSNIFNCSNTNITRKDRSDDKGPEPEGVALGEIGGSTYAFISLERIGGVMVYDVTTPSAPSFVTYVNNRSLSSATGDRGAEGIIFIPQSQSPNGQHIVVAANEVSSSLSIWGIPGCTAPISGVLSVSGTTLNACANNPPVLSVPSSSALTYQWNLNGSPINGATSHSITVLASGNYSVAISGGTNCSTSSLTRSLTVNPSPTISVAGSSVSCSGASVSQTVTGAVSYIWSNGSTSSVALFSPTANIIYTVTGTDSNSCSVSVVSTIAVNALPQLTLSSSSISICSGQSTLISVSGASTYSWNTSHTTQSISVSPGTPTNYLVSGTSNAGCTSTAMVNVQVNYGPTIAVAGTASVCAGAQATFTASGANSYTWSSGATGSVAGISSSVTTVYFVTGSGTNSCNGVKVFTLTIEPTPTVIISGQSTVCSGSQLTLSANGAAMFTWSNGQSGAIIALTPTASGNFTVTGSTNGCTATAVRNISLVPLPGLLAGTTSTVICAGESATLNASGALSYTWNNGSTLSSIVVSPTLTQTYFVTGAGTGNCISTATLTQIVSACTSITQSEADESQIRLYPNPGINSIKISGVKDAGAVIRIFDATGRLVLFKENYSEDDAINIGHLGHGMYHVSIEKNSVLHMKRLIVN